jgi:hypothetical protein
LSWVDCNKTNLGNCSSDCKDDDDVIVILLQKSCFRRMFDKITLISATGPCNFSTFNSSRLGHWFHASRVTATSEKGDPEATSIVCLDTLRPVTNKLYRGID